jgi:HEPN domain-containing protein
MLPVPDSVYEFHVQQAIEKLLKALIAAHGSSFPFVHDLRLLLDQIQSLGETVPDFGMPLAAFTKFGVASRYDSGVPLTASERAKYLSIVRAVRAFVTERVALLP